MLWCITTLCYIRPCACAFLVRAEKAPDRYNHGNWLVTIGSSPLLQHGYNHTISRHQALNHRLTSLAAHSVRSRYYMML